MLKISKRRMEPRKTIRKTGKQHTQAHTQIKTDFAFGCI